MQDQRHSSTLRPLRDAVLEANLALARSGLVKLTWGNVSGFDRAAGLVVIKPSGVPYDEMGIDDLVVVDLEGDVVEGSLRPSSDTETHLALYRAFPELGGIVHTHSAYATAFAQARREIPILGTTHADLAPIPIPLTRQLTEPEIAAAYEASTGRALVELASSVGLDRLPAALVPGHGVFAWGHDPTAALEVAITVEEVARIALYTSLLVAEPPPLPVAVREKHFRRKHGPGSYYGQLQGKAGDQPGGGDAGGGAGAEEA